MTRASLIDLATFVGFMAAGQFIIHVAAAFVASAPSL